MIVIPVAKEEIIAKVTRAVKNSKKEVSSMMLLSDEILNPFPTSYHALFRKKSEKNVRIQRLGFGTRKEHAQVKKQINMPDNSNFLFKCYPNVSLFQRMIVVDREILYFATGGIFLKSTYQPLINSFLEYFNSLFRKGRH